MLLKNAFHKECFLELIPFKETNEEINSIIF